MQYPHYKYYLWQVNYSLHVKAPIFSCATFVSDYTLEVAKANNKSRVCLIGLINALETFHYN